MNEVKQQSILPVIRSYLKLYTSIPISKLAKFLETDENSLRTSLLCFAHKTTTVVNGNVRQLSSDIHFHIDDVCFFPKLFGIPFYLLLIYCLQDMIKITEVKQSTQVGQYLLDLIEKFDNLTARLEV